MLSDLSPSDLCCLTSVMMTCLQLTSFTVTCVLFDLIHCELWSAMHVAIQLYDETQNPSSAQVSHTAAFTERCTLYSVTLDKDQLFSLKSQ